MNENTNRGPEEFEKAFGSDKPVPGQGAVGMPYKEIQKSEQDLTVAEKILLDAGDVIRQRLKEHGNTSRSFTMAAEMWTTYVKHAFTIRGETKLEAHDVAMMLSMLKTMRIVYGFSEDNFIDGAGYTALAALLHPKVSNGA